MPPDVMVHFYIRRYGENQWWLEFTTINGISKQGFPEGTDWPYLGDELKWNRHGEDEEVVKQQVKQLLQKYLENGKFAQNLKVYKSVSIGVLRNCIVLYKRE